MRINFFRYALILTLWSLPIILHEFFEGLFDKYWVLPIISTFEASVFADILLLLLLGITTAQFIYSKWIKAHLDWSGVLFGFAVTSYLFLYRFQLFGLDHWFFHKTVIWNDVAYVDFLLTIPILFLLFKIVPQHRHLLPPIDNNHSLLDDSPIRSISNDELNRNDLALLVAKYVINTNSERSFAIGINAKWGDGKTSFQEMVGGHVRTRDPNAIVFSYNPWRSTDEKAIIIDFFELFGEKVKVLDIQLGRQIIAYGEKILDSGGSWWNTIVHYAFQGERNQEAYFNDINESLLKIDRKVVVFIDDLDRLSAKEIIEVVKLIRSSANFHNTFFIVGYDLEYVHEALRKHSEYGGDDFLEKIFQIQFELSKVPPAVILQKLKSVLVALLPGSIDQINKITGYESTTTESFESLFTGIYKNRGDFITDILKNLRDVKRFANFFSINFKMVETEVDFEEYFYLALVRFKYPALISKIIENGKSF